VIRIATDVQATGDGALAYWVACCLDGFALGNAPMMLLWRLPPLYQSGVRFAFEPGHGTGQEDFAQPPVVYTRRFGDCDDLVNWRLSELLAQSLPKGFLDGTSDTQLQALNALRLGVARRKLPHTMCQWVGTQLHVMVRHPDGSIEDPSRVLGAKG
jgi:hypothetical protein